MVERIDSLDPSDLAELVRASSSEGYGMIDRLSREYQSGVNRFDQPGEALFGVRDDAGALIAVGGLNAEQHPDFPGAGRVRRVYVHPAHRRKGIGREIVGAVIRRGLKHFRCITCNVGPLEAGRFYESVGFRRVAAISVTHVYRSAKPGTAADDSA
jgi:GNAT superfamily N-acetyltransferase